MRKDLGKELAEEFLDNIGKAMRGMGAVLRRELDRHGVTAPQAYMLKVVGQRVGASVTELSQMMMIATPTASRMIDCLCAKGLLKKEKDASDMRVARVTLTAKSRRLLESVMDLQSEIFLETVKEEDGEDIARCMRRLGEIADRMCEIAEARARTRSEDV